MVRRPALAVAVLAGMMLLGVPAAGAASGSRSPTSCEPPGIGAIGNAEVNQTVSITGCGFGAAPKGDGVDFWARTGGGPAFFRSAKAGIVTWTDTEIAVVVPVNATNGTVKVTAAGGTYTASWTPSGAYIFQATACRSGTSTTPAAPGWHFKTRQWDLIAVTITRTGGAHVTGAPTGWVVAKDEHAAVGIWDHVADGGATSGPSFKLDAPAKWVVCSIELGGVIGTLDRVGGATSGPSLVHTWDSGSPNPTTVQEEGVVAGISIGSDAFTKTGQDPADWFVVTRHGSGITGGFAYDAQPDPGVPEVTVTDTGHSFKARGVLATFV